MTKHPILPLAWCLCLAFAPSADAEEVGVKTGTEDLFGYSLALSDSHLVVGAPFDGPDGGAFLYERVPLDGQFRWRRVADIRLPEGDDVGAAVEILDDTVFVGSPRTNEVIIYSIAAGQVTRRQTLRFPGAIGLGEVIEASGDRLFVSAFEPGSSGAPGSVVVFHKASDGSYYPQQSIQPRMPASTRFGAALAVEGNMLLVGAPGYGPGRVLVFENNGQAWHSTGTIENAEYEAREFGTSISLLEGIAVVGSPGAATETEETGSVQVFIRIDTQFGTHFQHSDTLAPLGGPRLGSAVMIRRAPVAQFEILAGAPGGADDVGQVFSIVGRTGRWDNISVVTPQIGNGRAGDHFGAAIAVNRESLAVGAPLDDSQFVDQGTASLYIPGGTRWVFEDRISALTEAKN